MFKRYPREANGHRKPGFSSWFQFKGIAVLARAGKPRLCEHTPHACDCVHGGGSLRRWLLSGSQLRNNRLKVRAGPSFKGLPTLTFHPYFLKQYSLHRCDLQQMQEAGEWALKTGSGEGRFRFKPLTDVDRD